MRRTQERGPEHLCAAALCFRLAQIRPGSRQKELRVLNSARFHAASADVHLLVLAVHFDGHVLNIRMPDTIGSSMRMADVVAEVCAFSADITFRHFYTSRLFGFYSNGSILSETTGKCKEKLYFSP